MNFDDKNQRIIIKGKKRIIDEIFHYIRMRIFRIYLRLFTFFFSKFGTKYFS